MKLTESTTRKVANEILESIMSKFPDNMEMLADPNIANDLQLQVSSFVLERIKLLWTDYKQKIIIETDIDKKAHLKDSVMKRIIITCLFTGISMETSSLILAEVATQ